MFQLQQPASPDLLVGARQHLTFPHRAPCATRTDVGLLQELWPRPVSAGRTGRLKTAAHNGQYSYRTFGAPGRQGVYSIVYSVRSTGRSSASQSTSRTLACGHLRPSAANPQPARTKKEKVEMEAPGQKRGPLPPCKGSTRRDCKRAWPRGAVVDITRTLLPANLPFPLLVIL